MQMLPKRIATYALLAIIATGLIVGGTFVYKNYRGVGPALQPPPQDIRELLNANANANTSVANTNQATNDNRNVATQVMQNTLGYPLSLPAGFSIRVLADNLPSARDIAMDAEGNLWVSQLSKGQVSKLTLQDGKLKEKSVPFRNLGNPHGLLFDPAEPNVLYIAEERRVSKTSITANAPLQKLVDLPNGNNHNRRTLALGRDGRIYVSIGSSCNVCAESDSHNATVYSFKKDGTDFRVTATGLRNAAFLAIRPQDGALWATENGRDYLGDNLPPDEINIITAGKFYGWPYCYGANVQDTSFDRSTTAKAKCAAATPSHLNLQAHSAPLGLAFIPDTPAWPEDFRGDLLVAYHGSWNRTDPTGYMVVRVDVAADGTAGPVHNFISGWLTKAGALGRPVDVLPTDDGKLYITDDKAGLVYVVTAP